MVAKVKNKLPLTFTRFVGTLDDMIAKAKCTQKILNIVLIEKWSKQKCIK